MRLLLIESSVAAGAKGAISPAGHVAAGAEGGWQGEAGGERGGRFFARWLPPCGEHRLLQSHGGEI